MVLIYNKIQYDIQIGIPIIIVVTYKCTFLYNTYCLIICGFILNIHVIYQI